MCCRVSTRRITALFPRTDPLLLIQPLARVGMRVDPVPRDGQARSDPDALVLHDVVEQPLEADCAGGMADQTHVQPDRHHPRLSSSLSVEHVEAVLDEGEPRIGRPDPAGILAVVVGQGVGHDEVPAPGHRHPVRQLVVVGIRVVEEGGFLYDSDAYNDELPYWVTVGPYRQYQPSGRVPSVVSNDAMALWMCSRSVSRGSSAC